MTATETATALIEAYGTAETAMTEVLAQYRQARRDGNQTTARRLAAVAEALAA